MRKVYNIGICDKGEYSSTANQKAYIAAKLDATDEILKYYSIDTKIAKDIKEKII